MGLFIFAVFSILFAWILHLWHIRGTIKLGYKIPSNKLHTFLCWGKILSPKDTSYMHKHTIKYGSNSIMWVGPIPLFLTNDPQTLSDILKSKNCINKPSFIYSGITSIAGVGLVTVNEPLWSLHRKLFNKAFTVKILLSLFPIFQKEVNNTIRQIDASVGKRESIDMLQVFRELTLNISTKTTLSRNIKHTQFSSTAFAAYIHDILEYGFKVSYNPIWSVEFMRKLADVFLFKKANEGLNVMKNLIDESVKILQKNDKTNPSYMPEIDSTLNYAFHGAQQQILHMNEINTELFHIFFGAFETTSTLLYCVILLLAMHPEIQEQAYEEIVTVIPDAKAEITLEQVNQLTYLEMIFYETLRHFPSIPTVLRTVTNEPLKLSNGIQLPVGQIICIDMFSINYNKNVWGPNAKAFNPNHFLPSNCAERHPFAFIPFTKGQRVCIGMKYAQWFSKICLAKVIHTFQFSTDYKYEDLGTENHITLKLTEEPRLNAVRRKHRA